MDLRHSGPFVVDGVCVGTVCAEDAVLACVVDTVVDPETVCVVDGVVNAVVLCVVDCAVDGVSHVVVL